MHFGRKKWKELAAANKHVRVTSPSPSHDYHCGSEDMFVRLVEEQARVLRKNIPGFDREQFFVLSGIEEPLLSRLMEPAR